MTGDAAQIHWDSTRHNDDTPPAPSGRARPKRIVPHPQDAHSPALWERIQAEIPHRVPAGSEWTEHALCRTVDPELWFPEKGASTGSYYSARDICAQCPVRRECLESALDNNEQFGIWGGFSPNERKIIRRSRELYLRREAKRKTAPAPAAIDRRNAG